MVNWKKLLQNWNERAGNLPVERKSPKRKLKSMQKAVGVNQDVTHNGWKVVKLLPNVKQFKVVISSFDTIFAAFGIERRLPPTLEFKRHNNSRYNRYIKHQFRRMEAYSISNPLVTWRVGMHLIRKSRVFFTMGINHVFPKWHREMKLSSVVRLATAVRRIANLHESKLNFKRVYISKSNGQPRPLGVPSPEWRIYLHLINVILSFYLESSGQFHESQHGFRPGRGTASAWQYILEKVIHSKDIFEFDLKGFFDSVNLDYISDRLIKAHVPVNVVQLLYYINTCACQVKEPFKLNEFEHTMKKLIHQGKSIHEVVTSPRPLSYMYRVRGVPQGAPTSPVLACLALHESVLDRGMSTIMYADDGLYYGKINQPIITPNSGIVTANIRFNLSQNEKGDYVKTDWVKKDGVWKKPLVFLGLEYNGETNKLSAKTRKGSTLEYDKEDLIDAINNPEVIKGYEKRKRKQDWTSWEALIKSKLFGFVQSRLYQGSWNMDGYEQCFELNEKEGSWVRLYQTRKQHSEYMTIFNSTTFASEWLVKRLPTSKWKLL